MERQEIIDQIKSTLNNCSKTIASDGTYGDGPWTVAVKSCLAKLGEEKGFKICTSTKDKLYETEWLYDLVWYRENPQGFLIDVPLVVESEWKKNLVKDIKFDFEKLLLARSTLKLMICNCEDSKKVSYLEYFQKAIDVCPLVTSDDLFLIAILKLERNHATDFEFFELSYNGSRN